MIIDNILPAKPDNPSAQPDFNGLEQLTLVQQRLEHAGKFLAALTPEVRQFMPETIEDLEKEVQSLLASLGTAEERRTVYEWIWDVERIAVRIQTITASKRGNFETKVDGILALLTTDYEGKPFYVAPDDETPTRLKSIFGRVREDFKSLPFGSTIDIQENRIQRIEATVRRVADAVDLFFETSTTAVSLPLRQRRNNLYEFLDARIYKNWFDYYYEIAERKLSEFSKLEEQPEEISRMETLLAEARPLMDKAIDFLNQAYECEIKIRERATYQGAFLDWSELARRWLIDYQILYGRPKLRERPKTEAKQSKSRNCQK